MFGKSRSTHRAGAGIAVLLGIVLVGAGASLSLQAQAADLPTFTSSADTTVDSQTPSTNYGASSTIYASPTSWKAFVRFPTGEINDSSVITSAKLRVFGATTSTSRFEVHPASSAWSETTTYNTRPAWNSTVLGSTAGGAQANVWNEITIPVSAVSKTGNTNLGLIGTVSGKIGFQARENTNDPQLVLTYGSTSTETPTPTVTPTPTPTPTPTVVPGGPLGVPGTWTPTFSDEFNGTALDTTKWSPNWYGDGGSMNSVPTYASNVSVRDGSVWLRLDNPSGTVRGALIHTNYSSGRYQLPVGGYTEARVYFPGDSAQMIYNWPAWWASGPNWPSAGEHDIAEGLGGDLTVNYHGASNSRNYGTIPGDWKNAYHVYGLHRKATSADVYWDGKLVKSYPTGDNGQGEDLILNVGKSGSRTPVLGDAGAIRVDYVRAWKSN